MLKSRDIHNEEDLDLCCYYGTPFEPLEENETPISKPIPVHEQTVTDSRGRQRFHGAFTGGFSAGFFNSVGTEEGFEPSTFVSTRSERSSAKKYTVKDFMDGEDFNEFGIAPKHLKVSSNFCSNENLEKQMDVLSKIMSNPIDLGSRLLNRLGVRHGKGVGADVSRPINFGAETVADGTQNPKVYTCARPPREYDLSTESIDVENDVMRCFKLAPEDVNVFLTQQEKTDRKGLGFNSLNPNGFLARSSFTVSETVTGMKGQAFGVGAFEEEDDDIYAQENMNDYDFELGPSRHSDKRNAHEIGLGISDGFVKASVRPGFFKTTLPRVPTNYKPGIPKSLADSPCLPLEIRRMEATNSNQPHTSVPPKNLKLEFGRAQEKINSSRVADVLVKEKASSKTLEWNSHNSQKCAEVSKSNNQIFAPNTNSRFVSAGKLDTLSSREPIEDRPETSQEKAARLKMFGKLTRTVSSYKFSVNICKRFNVKATADNSMTDEGESGVGSINRFDHSAARFDKWIDRPVKVGLQMEKTPSDKGEILCYQKLLLNEEHSENAIVQTEFTKSIQQISSMEDDGCSELQASKETAEVLESLKNFNLLADVFGDESDSDETNVNGVSDTENYEFSKSKTALKNTAAPIENNFEKFFQVPLTGHSDVKFQQSVLEREEIVIPREDEDEDFGPSLPPEMLNLQTPLDNTLVYSKGTEKTSSELAFIQGVYDKVKKNKHKKHKKHKHHNKDEWAFRPILMKTVKFSESWCEKSNWSGSWDGSVTELLMGVGFLKPRAVCDIMALWNGRFKSLRAPTKWAKGWMIIWSNRKLVTKFFTGNKSWN